MAPDDSRRPLILLNVALAVDSQGGRDEDALALWRQFEQEASEVADDSALLRASARIRELEERIRRRERGEPEPEIQPEPEPQPEGGFSPHWSGIVLTAVGGAALVAGAVVGVVGLSKRSSVLEMCEGTVCAPEAEGDADALDGLALGADLLLWPGLALAAAGVVLMFTVSSAEDDEARSRRTVGSVAVWSEEPSDDATRSPPCFHRIRRRLFGRVASGR